MAHTIHQEIELPASAASVYDVLLSSKRFAEFTGAAAEIDASEGGAFACFDGHITGRNIELVPGERIVQAWRVLAWDPGVFSIVRFSIGEADGKTSLILDHTGYPESFHDHINPGWGTKYWEPLKAYLADQA